MEYPKPPTEGFSQANIKPNLKQLLAYQLNPLVGREAEISYIKELIQSPEVRLLTLIGPGGVGKTRLALQLATTFVEETIQIYVVPLAAINQANLVLPTLAHALELNESAEQPLLEQVQARLQSQPHLLVLDNFEQVLEARTLLNELLEGSPSLKLVVTSRSPLNLRDEYEFIVPPLALPDLTGLSDSPLQLAQVAAVRLFEQRVQALRPDFKITAQNMAAVARICVRLDGLPLALELAAGWAGLLPPQTLLVRLEHPLQMLIGGPVNAPERHQTLRNTIEWSYNFLNSSEQALFRCLAVFVGGCSLEAAQTVCGGQEDFSEMLFLQNLRSLVNKSLLQSHHLEAVNLSNEVEPETRLVMLETVREYALERLAQDPDSAQIRQRQLEYFHQFARQAIPQLQGVDQLNWLHRLEREQPNLRAALTWAETQNVETGLRLGAALAQFWDFRSYLNEGRQWLQRLLSRSEGQLTPGRAVALNAAGNLAQKQGDYDTAITFQQESLALQRQLGDRRSSSLVLNNLGVMFYHRGQYDQAGNFYRESLSLKREINSPPRSIAMSLNNLGELAQKQGDSAQAEAYYEEALTLQRGVGDQREIAILLLNLGELASLQGDQRRSTAFLAESLQLFYDLNDKVHLAAAVEEMGRVAALTDRAASAGQLFGAAEALRTSIGAPLSAVYQANYEQPLRQARTRLGETAWQTAWQTGQTLPLDAVLNLALSVGTTEPSAAATELKPAATPARPKTTDLMSERELEVLRLMALGLSNQQIAQQLVVTVNTVKWHLKNIYEKLNVNSRTQALVRAKELELF